MVSSTSRSSNPLRRLISSITKPSGKKTSAPSKDIKSSNSKTQSGTKNQKTTTKGISKPIRSIPVAEWGALLIAAEKNQFDRIETLLTKLGVDPNHADEEGQTALHVAARWGHAHCAEVLLECGANPNAPDKVGNWTPLHTLAQSDIASEENRVEVATALLNRGADTTAADTEGKIPVDYVDGTKHAKLMKKLAPRPPAIFAAVEEMKLKELQDLLEEFGASEMDSSATTVSSSSSFLTNDNDFANQTHRGKTPLLVAVEMLMVEAEKEVDAQERKMSKILSMIQLLLRKGASPHFTTTDEFGLQSETMLSQLLETLRRKMQKEEASPAVKQLQEATCAFLRSGAAAGQKLDSFLHQAARFDQVSFSEFLLRRAAPLIQRAAAEAAASESSQFLDDSRDDSESDNGEGAQSALDVNARGRQGLTALHFCARSGKMEMLRFLLSAPDINLGVKDDRGMTPLEAARVNNKTEVVKLLEEHEGLVTI